MADVFEVCFILSIVLTAISIVFGNLFDFISIEGIDIDINLPIFNIIPLSPTLYLMFFVVFGGLGKILTITSKVMPMWLITAIAAISGFAVAYLINRFIVKPLKKAENTSAPAIDELIGTIGKVNETIVSSGFGQIEYIVNGNSFMAPAKDMNGAKILKGSKVVICEIKDNIFYVTDFDYNIKRK